MLHAFAHPTFARHGIAAIIVVMLCEDGLQAGKRVMYDAELVERLKDHALVAFTGGRWGAYRGNKNESRGTIGYDQGGR